jgi:hypothetical protein
VQIYNFFLNLQGNHAIFFSKFISMDYKPYLL